MSNEDTNKVRRAKVIALIAQGKTYTQAGRELDIDRRTIYTWRQEPDFQEEIDRLQAEVLDATYQLLVSNRLDVAQKLLDIIKSDETADGPRVTAITQYFYLLGTHKTSPVAPPMADGDPETEDEFLDLLSSVPAEYLERALEERTKPKKREL